MPVAHGAIRPGLKEKGTRIERLDMADQRQIPLSPRRPGRHRHYCCWFLGLFRRGQIATPGQNKRALPKLGLEKAFWLSEHRSAELGDASGPDRRGVSGGYGTTTETAPFFGGKTD
jgi:hypothetical protein